MKTIELKDAIYGGRINVIIGTYKEFYDEHQKRWKGQAPSIAEPTGDIQEEYQGGYHCEMFGLVKGQDPVADSMIWINNQLDLTTQISCLSHELLHAALSLMEIIGINNCSKPGNQETITYWHSWALRECLNKAFNLTQPKE